jgi:ribosomal-protein-alanine N-acetyltransferase
VSLPLLLRRAEAKDARAIAALEAACFTHPWTEGQVEEELAGGEGRLALLLESPRRGVVAWAAFRQVLDELHVMTVAVAPGVRRRGLGRRLLRFALARAARGGARRALLEVRAGNREALALYETLGFRACGLRREYYRDPVEDAVVLARDGLADRPGDP